MELDDLRVAREQKMMAELDNSQLHCFRRCYYPRDMDCRQLWGSPEPSYSSRRDRTELEHRQSHLSRPVVLSIYIRKCIVVDYLHVETNRSLVE